MSNQSTGECCEKCKIEFGINIPPKVARAVVTQCKCSCHTAIPEWETMLKSLILGELQKYGFQSETYQNIKRDFLFGEPERIIAYVASLLSSKDKEIAMEREKVVEEIYRKIGDFPRTVFYERYSGVYTGHEYIDTCHIYKFLGRELTQEKE